LKGNDADIKNAHTNQAVTLSFKDAAIVNPIELTANYTPVVVETLKVEIDTSTTENTGFTVGTSLATGIRYSSVIGEGVVFDANGLLFSSSVAYATSNSFASMDNAIVISSTTILASDGNTNANAGIRNGLIASGGGRIGKKDGQPEGTITDELEQWGGKIWP